MVRQRSESLRERPKLNHRSPQQLQREVREWGNVKVSLEMRIRGYVRELHGAGSGDGKRHVVEEEKDQDEGRW